VGLEAALALPLLPARAPARVRVEPGRVHRGKDVLWNPPGAWPVVSAHGDGAITLEWPSACFSVARHRVLFSSEPGEDVEHLLLTVVWSVVLAAHGAEPLHGTVVARGGSALAVIGPSGAGKSTAGWGLIRRGWRLVSDDLLAVDGEGRATVGSANVRLAVGHGAAQGSPDGKVLRPAALSPAPVPLTTIVALSPEQRVVARLEPRAALRALRDNLYNPVHTHPGQGVRRFRLLTDLVERTTIYAAPARGVTPDELERLAEEAR